MENGIGEVQLELADKVVLRIIVVRPGQDADVGGRARVVEMAEDDSGSRVAGAKRDGGQELLLSAALKEPVLTSRFMAGFVVPMPTLPPV